jgi:exodeoxyribonuclease V gamma subunit
MELDPLVRFAERPVRALLRDRLGVNPSDYFDAVQDAIPVELDKLEEWGVGQRLLEGVLGGADMDACLLAEQARGLLPPARLAVPVLERIREVVLRIVSHAQELGDEPPGSLDVNLELPDGRTLAGTVTGIHGDTVRAVSYSRVRPRDRLRAWVKLLALTASRPERPFESVVIGRARADAYRADVTLARIPPLGADPAGRRHTAVTRLGVLLDLYDRGMREPLPLVCDTSAAYVEAVAAGRDGVAAAEKAWRSDYDRDREDREPEHVLAFGGELSLAELMSERPRPDERGRGWEETQTTRFGRYAVRLWSDLLAAEEFSDR